MSLKRWMDRIGLTGWDGLSLIDGILYTWSYQSNVGFRQKYECLLGILTLPIFGSAFVGWHEMTTLFAFCSWIKRSSSINPSCRIHGKLDLNGRNRFLTTCHRDVFPWDQVWQLHNKGLIIYLDMAWAHRNHHISLKEKLPDSVRVEFNTVIPN